MYWRVGSLVFYKMNSPQYNVYVVRPARARGRARGALLAALRAAGALPALPRGAGGACPSRASIRYTCT